jgi:hypothetical protein
MSEKIDKAHFDRVTKKYQGKNQGKTRAVIMDRASFERILAAKGVSQVAIYFAQDDAGQDTVAVVGIDGAGKVLYNTAENRGGLCPPNCPPEEPSL